MDITSLMYVLFLMVGGAIYYCIPEGFRWKWLILLSFIFVYASSTFGVLFILLTSGIVYFSARKIEKTSDAQEKKRVLLMTMILCFSVLIVLKYVVALPIFEKHTVLLDGAQQSVQEFVRMYLFPVGIIVLYIANRFLLIGCLLGKNPSRAGLLESTALYLLFSATCSGTNQ